MSAPLPSAVQAIVNQVNTYSAAATTANGVAYSGPIGDVSSAVIAPSIANQLGWSSVNFKTRTRGTRREGAAFYLSGHFCWSLLSRRARRRGRPDSGNDALRRN